MGENGDKILDVVKLFVDNINESANASAKDREKMLNELDKIKTKINTPPRTEELSAQIGTVESKVDNLSETLAVTNQLIKSMITTVRVAAALLGIAVILAAGIVEFGKIRNDRDMVRIEKTLDKYLLDKEEEKIGEINPEE